MTGIMMTERRPQADITLRATYERREAAMTAEALVNASTIEEKARGPVTASLVSAFQDGMTIGLVNAGRSNPAATDPLVDRDRREWRDLAGDWVNSPDAKQIVEALVEKGAVFVPHRYLVFVALRAAFYSGARITHGDGQITSLRDEAASLPWWRIVVATVKGWFR